MKAQVSLEYIIIFGIAAIFFIAALAWFPQQLQQVSQEEQQAQAVLKELKLHVTAASTSQTNYSATIQYPRTINSRPTNVTILSTPDNVAYISFTDNNARLATVQLPVIDSVYSSEQPQEISIRKSNNQITIIIS